MSMQAKLVVVFPKVHAGSFTHANPKYRTAFQEPYNNWLDEYVGKSIYVVSTTICSLDSPREYRLVDIRNDKLHITEFCIFEEQFKFVRDVVIDSETKTVIVEKTPVKKYKVVVTMTGDFAVSSKHYKSLSEYNSNLSNIGTAISLIEESEIVSYE